MFQRLGNAYEVYHPTPETFPDLYLRPLIAAPDDGPNVHMLRVSEGVGDWAAIPEGQQNDFSSTDSQVYFVPDAALVVDKTGAWKANSGIGINRGRIAEQSNFATNLSFDEPWNDQYEPDPATSGHLQHSKDHELIGRPIAGARGMARHDDGGLVLYEKGYVGTVGTKTSFSPWSGTELPANKKVTNIAVTSWNEFALVTCHDETTGKGELCVIALWGGNQGVPGWLKIYHGWQQSHPGAPDIGQYTGMKILGYVDLGIAYPTAVSCATERRQGRVEEPSGNAGALGQYDLNDQASRDIFANGNNKDVFARWGMAVVVSKTENKAVYVDLTALFVGYREYYTTTQELYDLTKPAHPDLEWWKWFPYGPGSEASWPYAFSHKPEWTPTVSAIVSVPSPTSVLVSEQGGGQLAVGTEGGMIYFWKGIPSVGTAPVSDGSMQVGPNITSLAYNKYKGAIRSTKFLAVSRGDRAVYFISNMGPGAKVDVTIRDARMKDPVHVTMVDTHGIEVELILVSDFLGKQVLAYRTSVLEYATQNAKTFGTGPNSKADQEAGNPPSTEPECTGVKAIPGRPFQTDNSNVN